MGTVELLTIEGFFQISGRGVVVVPDFSVPEGWKNRVATVVVAKPDGQQFEAMARFSLSHFNLVDPNVGADKRWRVVVLLLDRNKEELPVGSKILVSPNIKNAILPHS